MNYVCSFFGHRNFEENKEIIDNLEKLIESLIVNYNVNSFLFGSRSKFDDLCHNIVYNLKQKYPHIKTVIYICPSEGYVLTEKKDEYEKLYNSYFKRDIKIIPYDEVYKHKNWLISGRASYIERNYAMIDNSDYCVFYYNKNYLPKMKKLNKRHLTTIQPNSGTKLAFNYAKQKKKIVINVLKNINIIYN